MQHGAALPGARVFMDWAGEQGSTPITRAHLEEQFSEQLPFLGQVEDYGQDVDHLKDSRLLHRGGQHQAPHNIVSVGHGGRDTWVTWATSERAQAAGLQDDVQFHMFSSVGGGESD